jgi:HK97 family phage major capsid protein
MANGKTMKDPAIEAIQSLGDSVASSFEILQKENEVLAARVDAAEKTARKLSDESWSRNFTRQTAFRGPEMACYSAEVRAMASMFENSRRLPADGGLFASPANKASVCHWFNLSTRIQRSRGLSADTLVEFEKLNRQFADTFSYETAATFTSGSDTLGGHWIPDPVAAELYRQITDNSVVSRNATHVPMTTKTLDLPVEGSSSLTVTWGAENTNITDSVPGSNAINKVVLTANRLNGFAASSLEELQDSPVSILSWIQTKLVEQSGRELDRVLLEGLVGAAPLFAGLGTAAGVNAITTGANGDALTYLMLPELAYKARERASRDKARWYCSPELMGKIIGLTDSTGQPIVQFGNVPGAISASVLGYPVEVHSVIKADRTYGTGTTLSHIYFGPPSQIVIGDRMGMSWDVSDQVGFQAVQVAMRLITRVGMGIAVPGAFSRHENIKT